MYNTYIMQKEKQYHVINYMEELVDVTLRGLVSDLPKTHRPSSRRKADIKALALNRLWPLYVTSDKGRRFVQRDIVTDQIDRDVTRELRVAINKVDRNPRK